MPNLTFLALFSVTLPQKLCSSTLFPGLTKVFFWQTFLIILIFPAPKPSIISGIHTGDDRLMLTGARQILQLSKEDLGETIGVERSVVNWSTYWINVADRWLSGMLAQWLFSRETEAFIFFWWKPSVSSNTVQSETNKFPCSPALAQKPPICNSWSTIHKMLAILESFAVIICSRVLSDQ